MRNVLRCTVEVGVSVTIISFLLTIIPNSMINVFMAH